MSWTDEMVAELTKLWEEGLTTGEIGKRLGISKNAVVGKAHRLNLQSRPSPIKQSVVKKKKEDRITSYNVCYTKLLRCSLQYVPPAPICFPQKWKSLSFGSPTGQRHILCVKSNKPIRFV